MKNFILLTLAVLFFSACSGDDDNTTLSNDPDSYSAHMKLQCPTADENQVIWDVCVTEPVYDYLAAERTAAGVNNCCLVEFEDINGNVVNGYLIRVEKNKIDCPSE